MNSMVFYYFYAVLVFCLAKVMKKEILIIDPLVLSVDIRDNGEKMIDIRKISQIITDDTYYVDCLDLRHSNHAYVRESVAEKLLVAQSYMPNGWNIKLVEGHRSLEIQEMIFNKVYEQRKNEFPNLTHEELFNKTVETVSPIKNIDGSVNIPAHGVGGAVDIKVFFDNGEEVSMGKFPEEDITIDPGTFKTFSHKVSKEQQENRKTLCQVMEKAGFVNYPYEWWHYSYGDRYWAFLKNKEYAIYDLILHVA